MSMHEIEGSVQDSIHLLNTSKKSTQTMENGEDESGVIPDYILFHLAIMIPVTFLFNAIDKVPEGEVISNNKQVKEYYKQFKDLYDLLQAKGASEMYLESLRSLEKLLKNGMFCMIHHYFIRYYRDFMAKPM